MGRFSRFQYNSGDEVRRRNDQRRRILFLILFLFSSILSTDGTYDYKIATLFNYYPRVMNWRDCNWIYTAINQVLAPSLQCLTGLCTDDRSTYGDDGGPVFCQGTMKVIGIVCNTLPLYGRELEFPQTFCPLAPYVEWIQMTRMKWEFIL